MINRLQTSILLGILILASCTGYDVERDGVYYKTFDEATGPGSGLIKDADPDSFVILESETVTPILYVADMARSLEFYVGTLGFKKAEWGDDTFTSVKRDKAAIYLCKGGQGLAGTWIWIGF